MTQPSIDRTRSVWPVAVETAVLKRGRGPSVAPVNSHQESHASAVASPSAINMIGIVHQSVSGESGNSSAANLIPNGTQVTPRDRTVSRPDPQKVQDPPPEPISKMLMDQIKSLWKASAGAVRVPAQVKNQMDQSKATPNVTQGVIATVIYTYSASKINKPDTTRN